MCVSFKLNAALEMLALWIFCATAGALEPEWSGLRVANAVKYEGAALDIVLDGKAWSEVGMESGEVSSLRRLPAGRHLLHFSVAGLERHRVALDLKADEVVTLVPYLQWIEAERCWCIRVFKLDAVPMQDERSLAVVHLGQAERQAIEIKQDGQSSQLIALRPLELEIIPLIQNRGYMPMRVGEERLPSMPVFGHGRHIIILYQSTRGNVACLFYRDRSWPK